MVRPHSIPYYAPADTLPEALPTAEEIIALIHRHHEHVSDKSNIVVIKPPFVIKFGFNVHLQEGQNMMMIKQHTDVPVPTVYALFQSNWMNFIVMEYIPGSDLRQCWETLTADEKADILKQLRECFAKIRAIPSPDYYGGIGHQPIRDVLMTLPPLGSSLDFLDLPGGIVWPCSTEAMWVSRMLTVLEQRAPGADLFQLRLRMYPLLDSVFRGHRPVFTHASITLSNIMLGQDGKIYILDWAQAGWYPSCWEYCRLLAAPVFPDEFRTPGFLDPYPDELTVMLQMRNMVYPNLNRGTLEDMLRRYQ